MDSQRDASASPSVDRAIDALADSAVRMVVVPAADRAVKIDATLLAAALECLAEQHRHMMKPVPYSSDR